MKQKPEESIRIYAAGLFLKQLDVISSEIPGVRKQRDIEAVHRMRVSTRRMRAVLDVFQDCLPAKRGVIWEKEIHGLTSALGAARDTDVQIDSISHILKNIPDPQFGPGIRRLLLRLKQKRNKIQDRLLKRLTAYEHSGVAEEMRAAFEGAAARSSDIYLYTPALYQRSFDTIHSAFETFSSYEDSIQDPANVADLHAMRIAGKNLRYTMECFSSIYANELKNTLAIMRTAQELLGSIHDCDVWIQFLPGFVEEEHQKTLAYFGRDRYSNHFIPGVNYLLSLKQGNREEQYKEFIEKWYLWKTEKVWENLFQVLQVPFFNKKEIIPLSQNNPVQSGGNT